MTTTVQERPVAPRVTPTAVTDQIAVRGPATGEELGSVPVFTADQVRDAIGVARKAQASWAKVAVTERARLVRKWRDHFLQRAEEIIDLLVRENGKTREEAILAEVSPPVMLMTYYAAKAPKFLRPRKRSSWGLSIYKSSTIHHVPLGVVGVISPWNYPCSIPMSDIVTAIVGGNGVALKPSEWTPLVALKLKEIFDDSGMPVDLFQVVTGYGPTGGALIEGGVDKITFTGSVAVGRRVAAACAERLLPCTLELGGKAPAVVLEDADVERAARAIVWGKFANCGQTCVAVERVYAVEAIHDRLLSRMTELVSLLRQGDPAAGEVDMGAMTMPRQIDVVDDLVRDAVARGARALTGGWRREGIGQFYPPTIVAECAQDMPIMHEEIFGPALPVMKVKDEEEAVRLANDSHLGLNAYVFGGNKARARRVAERLRAGTVVVNDVLVTYAFPELPFGGVKASGIGRVHGEEGLLAMCEKRVVTSDRFPVSLKRELWWHPYSRAFGDRMLGVLERLAHGLDTLGRL
ncbi:MAG: aldehyde dehydrogenase family protein [Candidatus Schekmanbacteria bacterium]|nr:aldehyde dehydrogenase family protein [Candidatus Schekmanbacteria bacterium]